MIGRILGLLFGFVAAVFLVTLAVANRHTVRLVLDPFNPVDPIVALELPFYAYLFAMLIVGVILGGIATWFSQSRWRRLARNRGQDAARWRAEAERLMRERDALVAQQKSASQSYEKRHLALAGH
nr:MAG: hypothetical protein DIU57_05505 [Pseudomonadota bacterium]